MGKEIRKAFEMISLVFDTSALLAYLKGEEPEASELERIILAVEQKKVNGIISTITMTEIYYILASESVKRAEERFEELEKSMLKKVPIDIPIAKQAGKLKAKYKISIADCIIAATAIDGETKIIIVSRKNIEDFKRIVEIKALLPKEALNFLRKNVE